MEICALLKSAKHICIVGISDKPGRDSGRIALMLKKRGLSCHWYPPYTY
ncbi:MAG: hypothetical protein IPG53_19800 [Ignavibacteriales bacterium]|nr:hypothetical protein [Ignavibacteriales bacterium]